MSGASVLRRLTQAGLALLTLLAPALAQTTDIQAPPGFHVSLIADDDLAPNCYCLTIDSLGRPTVAGPGYIRILTDEDEDGRMDRALQFSSVPGNGAQGMCWVGRDLYCVGDQGVLRLPDVNGDDRADGPPQLLLKISTGGEHDAHALRRGPDGWWYLLSGNNAVIDPARALALDSPVAQPQAGVLWRISPDFSKLQAWAHGFRNAYDFDFSPQGEIFVYDSDGERDVTLPWYRPTRVFQVLAGSHAGWISRSWKRDAGHPDMPPVLAALGRGSPTGVLCYRHTAFPPHYQGAFLALDWTFGRVMALALDPSGSAFRSEPESFLSGIGVHGFAPTDLAVAADGALLISVGGRGTRGGVYRVEYRDPAPETKSPVGELARCLTAPQPLDSWSQAQWRPLVESVGAAAFNQAATDTQRPMAQRLRAIEIATEFFGGLPNRSLQQLLSDRSPSVRARAAWSVGMARNTGDEAASALLRWIGDDEPLVRRSAWEALFWLEHPKLSLDSARSGLDDDDRWVRTAAARRLARQDASLCSSLMRSDPSARVRLTAAWAWDRARPPGIARRWDAIDSATQVVLSPAGDDEASDLAAQILVSVWGDAGPGPDLPAVFDGYRLSGSELRPWESSDVLQRLREELNDGLGEKRVAANGDWSRVAAVLALDHPRLLRSTLAALSRATQPSEMIHALIVAARLGAVWSTSADRAILAEALVRLPLRVRQLHLNVDGNWEPRLSELFAALLEKDPLLAAAVMEHPDFGDLEHVLWARGMNDRDRPRARQLIASRLPDDVSQCTPEVVQFLGESAAYRDLIRRLAVDSGLQETAIWVLAQSPQPEDRPWYVRGLSSGRRDVVQAALRALQALPPDNEVGQQTALYLCARRQSGDPQDRALGETALRLLQRNLQPPAEVLPLPGSGPRWDALRDWLIGRFPDQRQALQPQDLVVEELLESIPWERGRVSQGQSAFRRFTCHQCHGGNRALGPDLAGVGRRFSRADLLVSILHPNRDVSSRYQTTAVQTVDGQTYSGLVIYQSVDGVTLRTSDLRTVRIEARQIERQDTVSVSLMPSGLLREAKPQEIADLMAYLQGL